jgi:hypothetical protein
MHTPTTDDTLAALPDPDLKARLARTWSCACAAEIAATPAAGRTAQAGDAGAAGGAPRDHAPLARPGWAQARALRPLNVKAALRTESWPQAHLNWEGDDPVQRRNARVNALVSENPSRNATSAAVAPGRDR